MRQISVASVSRKSVSGASPEPEITIPAGKERARAGDKDMQDFDLRDALAGMTVRETSFKEFLTALKSFAPGGGR